MKLTTLFSVFSLTSLAFAASSEPKDETVLANDSEAAAAADNKPNLDFGITYEIADHVKDPLYRLFNEEEVSLKYTFQNREEVPIKIVGVGGSLKNPDTLASVVNLTDAAIGPFDIDTQQQANFVQKIGIDVNPSPYVLAPLIYISYNDILYVVTPTPALITVEDKPISIFDPQLLLALLILVSSVGAVGYFVAKQFAIPYINKNYLKKNVQKPVKPVAVTRKAKSTTTTSTTKTTGSAKKAYDEDWLPKTHLKQTRRKN